MLLALEHCTDDILQGCKVLVDRSCLLLSLTDDPRGINIFRSGKVNEVERSSDPFLALPMPRFYLKLIYTMAPARDLVEVC